MTRTSEANATSATDRRFALSMSDVQNLSRGRPVDIRLGGDPSSRESEAPFACCPVQAPEACGTQDFVSLSDDLVLARSNVHSTRRCDNASTPWEIDTRGWLYLHFRLDGVSVERLNDESVRTVTSGSFIVCASSQPRAFVREVLSDAWRVVTLAFRPSFAFHNLPGSGAHLPAELRRFRSGDADVDFFYASPFTPDMASAARGLLQPTVTSGLQEFYLRAKAVELVCLAVEHVGRPEPEAEPPHKLTHRDILALEEAKRRLDIADTAYTLELLARKVGLNRRKLSLGFKLLFGVTVGDHHREVRLELARRILESTASSVAYAASVAGYSDVGSFGKAFKARFGSLPSKARTAPLGGGTYPKE